MKALRDARKLARREGKIARNAKRSVAIGEKEEKLVPRVRRV